jgi:hypothetical protein
MSKNIYEFVYFSGDTELLKFRIEKNISLISKLSILTTYKNSKKISDLFSDSPKIKIIIDNETWDNEIYYSKLIKNEASEICKNFDDVVLISNEDEFAEIEKLMFLDTDSTSINILFNKVYENNFNYYRKYLEYGNVVLSFSQILQIPTFLEVINSYKKKLPQFVSFEQKGITLKNFRIDNLDKTYICPYSGLRVPLLNEKPLI